MERVGVRKIGRLGQLSNSPLVTFLEIVSPQCIKNFGRQTDAQQ